MEKRFSFVSTENNDLSIFVFSGLLEEGKYVTLKVSDSKTQVSMILHLTQKEVVELKKRLDEVCIYE